MPTTVATSARPRRQPVPGPLIMTPPPAFPLSYRNDVWYPNGIKIEGLSKGERAKLPGLLAVPKRRHANLRKRYELQQLCEQKESVRRVVVEVCAQSPTYWINMFGWTYRPKFTCTDGQERSAGTVWFDAASQRHKVPGADTPIITWPAQDGLLLEIESVCRDGGVLLGDKSREQGFTVITMGFMTWALLYWRRFSALVLSYKHDLVDGKTEDSLLGKIDYMLGQLPEWMYDPTALDRSHAPSVMSYEPIGTRVIGETSTKNTGQSLRTTVTFVDEAARFPWADSLQKSIESVSAAQIWGSTPNGPRTTFSKLIQRAATKEGREAGMRKFTLGYWDHPQKGRARTWRVDADGSITGKPGSGYWETPAFARARGRSVHMRDIRENWLIDHETSGALVLEHGAVERLRPACSVGTRGKLLPASDHPGFVFVEHPDGPLTLWCDLDDKGRPSVLTNYVMGWDFGQGVEQSNTIGAVMDRTTGVVVAEFADSTIAPHKAALEAVRMGLFFGGQLGAAFVIWENNGPGFSFGHEIVSQAYPFLYYQRAVTHSPPREGKVWGWTSTQTNREILFSRLDKALRAGEFATPSALGLDDLEGWFFDEYGRIVCGTVRDLSTGAQARHGDRAIAYGLCVMGRAEVPYYEPERPFYPPGTIGFIAGFNDDEEAHRTHRRPWYKR